MTETIDKAEFLRLARAAGFYHYDMPDVEGQDLGQSLEADGRGAVDRLVASLQAHITDRLAAAEARNATLTDEAARVERNRDMWKDQCARQAKQLETLQPIARRYLWLRDRTAAPSWYAAHANMGISCEVFDMRLDAEIARAAASISTKKGDGHADT